MSEEKYLPESDEIFDAIIFLRNCTDSDAVESFSHIMKDWNINAVMDVHKDLCDTGRIEEITSQILSCSLLAKE